jgi:Cdc6-like AAA superfamily ATPase
MKFYESHFEEYIQNPSIHNKLNKIYEKFPSNLKDLKNIILYGPSGVGKYTQMLYIIKPYSPSELKYEKKISITCNKSLYYFKISDIHYEIDMSLLGCQSKLLWNEFFSQIIDIINATKSNNIGIIVCKYFEKINNELLENFYSYMQTLFNNNIYIKFIIITEEISFIPENILNACQIINVERPSNNIYNKHFKNNFEKIENTQISNIKILKAEISNFNTYSLICNKIIDQLINYKGLKFIAFRELIYNIFIYNINIFDIIWYILSELIKINKITQKNITPIIKKTYQFLQYYNNNYRPIYHLESYLLYLITEIHEF